MKDSVNLNQAVGQLVKEARAAKGWSQQRLAETADLKRTSISNIESGRQSLSLSQFCNLMEILNQNPGQAINVVLNKQPSVRKQRVHHIVKKSMEDAIIKKHVLDALVTVQRG